MISPNKYIIYYAWAVNIFSITFWIIELYYHNKIGENIVVLDYADALGGKFNPTNCTNIRVCTWGQDVVALLGTAECRVTPHKLQLDLDYMKLQIRCQLIKWIIGIYIKFG